MNKNKIFFIIQAILRYVPFQFGISLRNLLYPTFFKAYGKNVRIFDAVIIKYPNDISIGSNVTINQFSYIVGKGGLQVGDDVMIGAGSKMTTTSHDFESTITPMRLQGISCKPIVIEHDVWLGFNVVVLGGSIIRQGSILATAAVINGSEFPAFSVVGGVPAKLLKSRK